MTVYSLLFQESTQQTMRLIGFNPGPYLRLCLNRPWFTQHINELNIIVLTTDLKFLMMRQVLRVQYKDKYLAAKQRCLIRMIIDPCISNIIVTKR